MQATCNASQNVNRVQQINRGDIYMANLSGGMGSEQSSSRPVVVIQNAMGNKFSPCCTVIPLTSRVSKKWMPTHVTLKKNSLLICSQYCISRAGHNYFKREID